MKIWLGAVALVMVFALSGCGTVRQSAKSAAMQTPFVMGKSDAIAVQRPPLPTTHLITWTPEHRLYRSVVIDFVEGMSQDSYIFAKPNQRIFRRMLTDALNKSGLLARTPEEARYALQISFKDVDTAAIGIDFAGRSKAEYRIVSRMTGEVVFQKTIGSRFLVKYPELNENDVADMMDISLPGFSKTTKKHALLAAAEGLGLEAINSNEDLRRFFGGPFAEASQTQWDNYNQAFIWTEGLFLVAGPAEIIRRYFDPTNYIAFAQANTPRNIGVAGARKGYLSEGGVGLRDGSKRAMQASEHMLGQSITKMMMDLSASENVRMKFLLPCTNNREVQNMKLELMSAGYSYRTGACSPDDSDENLLGVGYTTYK